MLKRVNFLKKAINGEKVGAVSRSSRFVIRNVIDNIGNINLNKVVEYGPGDGVLTVEILKLMPRDGKMLLVELDKNFINDLRLINDPRITIVNGKIEDVSGNLSEYGMCDVDLVVSSIPFSLIKKTDRESIVKNTRESLCDDGKFIIFHQYSLLMASLLKKYFPNVKISFEPRNFLPCFIMSAKK